MDDLIERLRERAADPKRRTDAPQSISFSGPGGTLTTQFASLDGMLAGGFSTDNSTELPSPAPEAALDAAEARLGFPLPAQLRRVYSEVANGGFGPGGGLLSVERTVAAYVEMTSNPWGPDQVWPAELLPIQEIDPGYVTIDVNSGRIIDWDPEELTERSGDRAWQASFKESASSLEDEDQS